MACNNDNIDLPVEISVVIPTWNRIDALSRCLDALLAQDKTVVFEVIVALDARDGLSEAHLVPYALQVRIVRSQNPGLNGARNRGAHAAHGQVIVFLDDDCILPRPDWVELLSASFRRHSEADAIGGLFLSLENAPLFVRCRNQMSNAYLLDSRLSKTESRVLLGGNSAYRKGAFRRWGFFNESLCYGATETELNERIVAGGGKLYFLEDISVVHAMASRSLFRHCCQAFVQGRGLSYICSKSKGYVYAGPGLGATVRSLWAIVNEQRFLWEKAGAIMFISLNIIFYKLGRCCGKLRTFLGASKGGAR